MDNAVERAAARAIATMHDNLGELVTVDDLARSAMFSKFHFTRMFQRATGTSPARFLSALRLQRAKHLLVSTTLNVVDISVLVGYNSVGTFSARFSRSVGVSPTAYRRNGGKVERVAVRRGNTDLGTGTVHGDVLPFRDTEHGKVFLGLFPERIPEGQPVSCAILDRPGPYRFEGVPLGSWYLLAQCVSADPRDTRAGGQFLSVGSQGPIIVRRDDADHDVDLELKPAGVLDPPVLLALSDARESAILRVAKDAKRHDLTTV